ncbi:MAG: polyprenyl synthetase family protein [Saprospiraceae bacterium]|nr:polyprenyl synthetase family protein [Saprospiraceae bacterium]
MANVSPGEELLKMFEKFVQESADKSGPDSLYKPIDYILSLGGKRIRPIALLLVSKLLNGNADASLHAAYGIELFHNFSLMHDDIMDASEFRRSQATVHKKFGVNAAILSGDVMLIDAMRSLRITEQISGVGGLTDLLLQTAKEVCEGQAMDMEFETRSVVNLSEYIEMIRLKTAVLLAACFKMAALISQRADLADALYELGIQAGIGFQLEDDWLDYYSENAAFGKVYAGDIRRGKKSGLILELAEHLDPIEKKTFLHTYQEEQDPLKRIQIVESYLMQYPVREKLRERFLNYKVQSFKLIQELEVSDVVRLQLREFIQQILERKK